MAARQYYSVIDPKLTAGLQLHFVNYSIIEAKPSRDISYWVFERMLGVLRGRDIIWFFSFPQHMRMDVAEGCAFLYAACPWNDFSYQCRIHEGRGAVSWIADIFPPPWGGDVEADTVAFGRGTNVTQVAHKGSRIESFSFSLC